MSRRFAIVEVDSAGFIMGPQKLLPDGPVVVVDGKVAALDDTMAVLCKGPKSSLVVQAMVEGLTNAAREVAE